jgi:hypothetical protein
LAVVGTPLAVGWAADDRQPAANAAVDFVPVKRLPCLDGPNAICLINLALTEAAVAGSAELFAFRILGASILVDLGHKAEALRLLSLALTETAGEGFPYAIKSLLDIAILQHRAGDDQAARKTLDKATEVALDGVPQGFGSLRLASAQIGIGDLAGAVTTVRKAVRQSACMMPLRARLPFLVAAANWYLESGNPQEVADIALRMHISLVRAGGTYGFTTGDAKAVGAIVSMLLNAGEHDTAAEFLGLSQAPEAAAPVLSAIEELPRGTSWGVLASFATSARR